MAETKRYPVLVPRVAYDKLKSYSQIIGKPMTLVLTEAVNDWLDTVGVARIERQTGVDVAAQLSEKAEVVYIDEHTSAMAATASMA